ncbi:MAG: hypothetical protein JWL62_3865 [Hyphomicrobiales bacterium]|nr:hypothetical protein [Hyphomicrobiales bacterium]
MVFNINDLVRHIRVSRRSSPEPPSPRRYRTAARGWIAAAVLALGVMSFFAWCGLLAYWVWQIAILALSRN